ncbi:MAG: hypothetical protein ACRDQF_01590 [Thermocrispum sp.]
MATEYPTLPPRPDPRTGEPFPPHGRAWRGSSQRPEDNADRETRLSRKPKNPRGLGPILAWHKHTKRYKVGLFLTSAAMLAAGGSVINGLNGDSPFAWVTAWPVWVVVVVFSLLITGPLTYLVLAVGADYASAELHRWGKVRKRAVVKLYELRKITGRSGPYGATYLELEDDRYGIDRAVHEWQADRRMWDLVYNGILHSVAAGTTINRTAWQLLELDSVEGLKYPTGVRTIATAALTDGQIHYLMADKGVARMLRAAGKAHIGPDRLRSDFPIIPETVLAGRPDPEWFAAQK